MVLMLPPRQPEMSSGMPRRRPQRRVVELQRVRDQRIGRVADVNAQEAPVDRERPAMDLLDDSGRICLFYFCLSLFPDARCCRAPLLRRRQIRT
jgi:hypothetical protein